MKSIIYAPFYRQSSLLVRCGFKPTDSHRGEWSPLLRSSRGMFAIPGRSLFSRFYAPIADGIWRRKMKAVSCSAPNAIRAGNLTGIGFKKIGYEVIQAPGIPKVFSICLSGGSPLYPGRRLMRSWNREALFQFLASGFQNSPPALFAFRKKNDPGPNRGPAR